MGKRKTTIESLHKELKKLKKKIKRHRHYDEHGSSSRSRSQSYSRSRSRWTRSQSRSRRSRSQSLSRSRSRSRSRPSLDLSEHIEYTALQDELQEVPNDITKLLGDEGIILSKKAEDLNSSLNTRWAAILQGGLNDDTRNTILKKYEIPNNCQLLLPPKLNEEVAAAMNENGIKRDKRIKDKQATLAVAISAVGQVLNVMLTQQKMKEIETLSDASRLLCDTFHNDTMTRRSLILPGLNKDLKDLMEETKISEYLFGDQLQDKVTACKAIKKSAMELKNTVPPIPKPAAKHKFHNNNLNYRGPQRPQKPRPSGPKPKTRRPTYQPPTAFNHSRRSPQRYQQRRRTRR